MALRKYSKYCTLLVVLIFCSHLLVLKVLLRERIMLASTIVVCIVFTILHSIFGLLHLSGSEQGCSGINGDKVCGDARKYLVDLFVIQALSEFFHKL